MRYSEDLLAALGDGVEDMSLQAVDRLAIQADAFALAKAGKLPTHMALAIADRYALLPCTKTTHTSPVSLANDALRSPKLAARTCVCCDRGEVCTALSLHSHNTHMLLAFQPHVRTHRATGTHTWPSNRRPKCAFALNSDEESFPFLLPGATKSGNSFTVSQTRKPDSTLTAPQQILELLYRDPYKEVCQRVIKFLNFFMGSHTRRSASA